MKTTTEQTRINAATSMDDPCDILNAIEAEVEERTEAFVPSVGDLVDLAALPTFGGTEPERTSEVWSWDERRILTADGAEWKIEDRCNCGEAAWHCQCEQ